MSESSDGPRLDVVDLDPDPMVAFESWFTAAGPMVLQHEAVVLSTADADQKALGADGAMARV